MRWDPEFVKQLISEAEAYGESGVICDSPREAELFRRAIINARAKKNLGPNIRTEVKENEVVLILRPNLRKKEMAA